jgi:hypothetical protein
MEPMLPSFGLGFKSDIVQGAVAGGFVSFLLSDGPWPRRLAQGLTGGLFSVYGTQAFMEATERWVGSSPAMDRLGGFVFGVIGIVLVTALLRGAERCGTARAG